MLRATFKSLLSRKARLLLSGIAVILGVTFISGALVLNASLGESVHSMFTTAYDNVDVQVNSKKKPSEFGSKAAMPTDTVDKIKQVDGVKDATGRVENDTGLVRVVGKDGKVPPSTGAPTQGINWNDPVSPMELRDGKGPKSDDEIVINQGLADSTGYDIGDTVPLITNKPNPTDYKVVGIVGYSGGRATLSGESTVMFTTDTARETLLNGAHGFTDISVTSDKGVKSTQLRDDLTASLGSDFKAQTGKDLAEDQTKQFNKFLDFFNYLLLGFGAVALIVSVFLIINTFSIIVAQRTKELALYRAMGAGRGQVTSSVLLEALVIGLFSGIAGLGLGIGVGYAGTTLMSGMADTMEATLSVPTSAIIAAFAVGVGVTMLAAILPALNASRIPPIAALRDAESTNRPILRFGIIGGILLAAGGGLLWAALDGKLPDNRMAGVMGGVALLFIGAAVFTPVLARPLVWLIGMIMSWSLPGKLGRRNSSRNPRRTAITASALMIGICLVTAVGVLLSSAQASIEKFMDTQISADLMIGGQQTGPMPPTFDPKVLDKTRDESYVDQVAGVYYTQSKVNGESASLSGTDDFAAMTDMLGDTVDKGDGTKLEGDEVAVYSKTAKKAHVGIGDTVDIKLPKFDKTKTFTVSAILAGGSGSWIMSDDNSKGFTLDSPIQGYVSLSDGADSHKAIDGINDIIGDNPLVSAADISVLNDQMTQIFDMVLLVVQILLGLAVFIAVIGVVNTLTLSVLERTRELGLLRAVGMTRGQVTRMVTVESIVISLFGALLGVGIGAGLGIAVQRALKDDLVDVLAMPWGTMAGYVIAAVVIGLFAAMIPAYRANRLDVLNAISHE